MTPACGSIYAKLTFLLILISYSIRLEASPILVDRSQSQYLHISKLALDENERHQLQSVFPTGTLFADSATDTQSHWYQFELKNNSAHNDWFLRVSNSLIATVLLHYRNATGRYTEQAGYHRHYPFDLINGVPLHLPSGQTTIVWLNLQSPVISPAALFTLAPKEQYQEDRFNYTSMVFLALGAMLALVLYNAFLYFPTRDPAFIWYAGYQLLCTFGWAAQFKVLLYCFELELSQSYLHFPFFIAAAASLMFAIRFLRLSRISVINLSLQGVAVGFVVMGLLGLALPFGISASLMNLGAYAWMLIMLPIGIWRYHQGFRPARFYVVGFSIIAALLTLNLMTSLTRTTLFDDQMLWALWAQLADSIALALALADRINFLRKSRQYADKRATTDQLTGLPNRLAFERDVRAWEAYCNEGMIKDFYLTFIDVDGLKIVNDSRGHNEGDRLLIVIAQWLRTQVNPQNLYRIGGDEFILLTQNKPKWNSADLHRMLDINGFPQSDMSMGTSSFSETGNRSTLLKLADERMYAVKHPNTS